LNVSFDEKSLKGNNELSLMMRKVSGLAKSFRKVAAFANHVGRGELNAEYELLGENDDLGKAMLDMRANLKDAEAEMEKSRREDERRNWATQGLAKFAEILRHDNDNMESLAYNIVSNMVKYLDANQGGIFVLSESENGGEKFLEMMACYAFDRKKFVDKQIRIGEGLVGTCYLEGEPIYITDVPDEYIAITSGLGDANPNAILISPLKVNDQIYGVMELASFREFEPYQLEFVQKVSESIASTIGSVKVNIRTGKLLEQSKIQAEEMANQEEELRQNMEEMQATQEEMRRREAELSKAVSENGLQMTKMKAIVDACKIGLWHMECVTDNPVDPNNVFLWSQEFRQMLGYSGEKDFPNVLHSWSGNLHPEDKQTSLDAFAKHVLDRTGKTPFDLVFRMKRKSGEYAYIHAFGATVRDAEGKALHVTGAIMDKTEEMKVAEGNTLQMTKMKAIVDACKIGLWHMDFVSNDPVDPNNVYDWSPEFRQMLGYTDETDFPNVFRSLVDNLHPEDRQSSLDAFANHLLDRTGQTPFNLIFRMKRKDGEYAYIHGFGATVRDAEGYARHVTGAIMDVTEEREIADEMRRREAELQKSLAETKEKEFEMQQFYNAIYHLNNVVELSPDAVVTDANQSLLNVMHVSRSDLVGKHMREIVGEKAYKQAWSSVKRGKNYEDVQVANANGTSMKFNQKFLPLCSSKGELLKVFMLASPEN